MTLRRLGGPAEVNTSQLIPAALKSKMEALAATIEAKVNQELADLHLLQALYQWNYAFDTKATHEGKIDIVRSDLVRSITRQVLDSDLFKPNPILKRFLDKRSEVSP